MGHLGKHTSHILEVETWRGCLRTAYAGHHGRDPRDALRQPLYSFPFHVNGKEHLPDTSNGQDGPENEGVNVILSIGVSQY